MVQRPAVGTPESSLLPRDAEQGVVILIRLEGCNEPAVADAAWRSGLVPCVWRYRSGVDPADVIQEHVVHRHRAGSELLRPLEDLDR